MDAAKAVTAFLHMSSQTQWDSKVTPHHADTRRIVFADPSIKEEGCNV